MSQAAPVVVLAVVFCVLVGLMYLGWRRRAARQGDLPALTPPPAPPGGAGRRAEGVYVATTLAEQPLERVTARGLGARSRAVLGETEHDGGPALQVDRQGAAGFLIPWADVRSVHTAPGMVGKWIGGDGLLVIRWQLGETLLDTGFRLDERADQDRVLALADQHLPATAPAAGPPGPSDVADPQPPEELS
ncbi:hypothetical protein BRM3_12670 [Brachybacterium huguangmaarense]|uniref:PH domain-containing protein n=1 Tax=Brachybacterium huguangmaarense TaxID=1652028 RepID=A0ABY6FZR9_9MICO|nr:hypothetical protein [Brachybacterium huguangmaarense]UYG16447.1 hypothetical protein BRM3_12670 [Brachybacterium huguangmaarense]